MIFDFLKKQKGKEKKLKIIKMTILELDIQDEIKALYIQALDIVDEAYIDNLYDKLSHFIKKLEIKEIEEIHKNSFAVVANMTKKEAEEKKKDINSFSFLLNNL